MPIDIYFFNSLAQFLMLAALMVIIFVLRKAMGSRAMYIGLEALLLTVLLRRVDEIGLYFGVDIFDRPAMVLLSWIVNFILLFAFVQAWRRRVLLRHIGERLQHQARFGKTLKDDNKMLGIK